MKYFIDVQYHSYEKKTGIAFINRKSSTVTEVISVGIVTEKGDSLYLINKDFDLEIAWGSEKVREDILKPMYRNVSPIYGDDISKNSIAMVKGEHGDYLQTVAYKLRSFIGRYTDKHVMYVNYSSIVALLLGPLGCEGTFDEYRIIDNEIKKFAGDVSWRRLVSMLGMEAVQITLTSKFDAIVKSHRFPKMVGGAKTAVSEALLCRKKYDFLETLKRELAEDKKKTAERIKAEIEEIDKNNEWQEKVKFIAMCKAGMGGMFIKDKDFGFSKKEPEYSPAKMEIERVPFFDDMNIYIVRCRQFEDAPKLATRKECDAPSRPKIDVKSTIPRNEMELMDEIQEKNDGKHYIDCMMYRDDSAEINVYNRYTGAVVLQVCGKKIEAMQDVLDFLNGKCLNLFCRQFEAVPNVNFRKRCVECGMEYDIKIKE
jgi:hypothetical protein